METTYDAAVTVYSNGVINIEPADYEYEKDPVTPEGGTFVARGRMILSSEGKGRFTPSQPQNKPQYRLLRGTEHSTVKAYGHQLVIHFSFPIKKSKSEIASQLIKECGEICKYTILGGAGHKS